MTAVPEPTGTLATALEHTTRLLKSDPVLAAEQASEILKVVPAHPVARMLLGIARRAAGDPAAALEVLDIPDRCTAPMGSGPLRVGNHAGYARSPAPMRSPPCVARSPRDRICPMPGERSAIS